ncbi:hypothetical protein [Moorena bouillonii]|uniref:Uncharacterized protein n=1 Tax=Moorena bouillonii PNG TaxID=568701 RepID=A0A1U7N9S3_9CYAN|nr:hypothetical protein [Moorena bouillonii]OLT62702.1 hypothetical protein BJP37_30410 [Moorena bouillonii PNG]
MSTVKREEISLYQEAKASLSSLFWQTAQVFTSLLVIFLFAGGSPPGWLVTTSFVVGTVFVFWKENKRTKDGSGEHKQINNNEQKPNKSMVPTYESYKQRKANEVLRRSMAEKETTIDDQSGAQFNINANYVEQTDSVSSEQSYAKQTNMDRESKIQKWQNYLNFALIIIIATAPLFVFGGYKIREFIVANFPTLVGFNSENYLNIQVEALQDKLKELEIENNKLEKKNQELIAAINSTPPVANLAVIERNSTDNNPKNNQLSYEIVEYKGIIYQFKSCQKSPNINLITQSISCAILITTTKENVQLSLYYNSSYGRSRLLEQGKEYVATKVEFGTFSNNRNGVVKNRLIKDVPIEAIITFDGVPLEVNQIDMLQFRSYLNSSYYTGYINTELRDLSVITEN